MVAEYSSDHNIPDPQRRAITATFAGLCVDNPHGHTSTGWRINYGDDTSAVGHEYLGRGAEYSNNVAEFASAGTILNLLRGFRDRPINIYGNSMLVIEIMSGRWKAKKGRYLPYYQECRRLADKFTDLRWIWIPFHENGEAVEQATIPLRELGVENGDYYKQVVRR